jgi:hypothetical protein
VCHVVRCEAFVPIAAPHMQVQLGGTGGHGFLCSSCYLFRRYGQGRMFTG